MNAQSLKLRKGTNKNETIIRVAKNNFSFKAYKSKLQKSIPAQRFADPQEISDLIYFLTSENASYITGQNLIIDGGLSKSI